MQSGTAKVGSSFTELQKDGQGWGYFIRCINRLRSRKSLPIGFGKCPKKLENVAFWTGTSGREKPDKVVHYQGITSYDVFADYQTFFPHKSDTESTLQKLGAAFSFCVGILLICFSVFLFSWNAENHIPVQITRSGLRVPTFLTYRHCVNLAQVWVDSNGRIGCRQRSQKHC